MSNITVSARMYSADGSLKHKSIFVHDNSAVAKADVGTCLQFGVKSTNIMVRRDGKLISYKDL